MQLVSSSTRGDDILDLILTNNSRCVTNVQVTDNLPGSDHDAVGVLRQSNKTQ